MEVPADLREIWDERTSIMVYDGHVPLAGQQGPAWIRWLDRYAQEHAAAVAPIAVRDLPPMVREQITQEEDGETMTPSNMQLVVTLLARLGAAHGLRQVPVTLEEVVALTQALVLEHALTTLHTEAVMGAFYVDDPRPGGCACWAPPSSSGSPRCWRPQAPRRRSSGGAETGRASGRRAAARGPPAAASRAAPPGPP